MNKQKVLNEWIYFLSEMIWMNKCDFREWKMTWPAACTNYMCLNEWSEFFLNEEKRRLEKKNSCLYEYLKNSEWKSVVNCMNLQKYCVSLIKHENRKSSLNVAVQWFSQTVWYIVWDLCLGLTSYLLRRKESMHFL